MDQPANPNPYSNLTPTPPPTPTPNITPPTPSNQSSPSFSPTTPTPFTTTQPPQPESTPQPLPPSQIPHTPQPRSVLKPILGLVVIVLLLGLSATAFFYTQVFANPQKVLADSLTNLKNMQSFTGQGSLTISDNNPIALSYNIHRTPKALSQLSFSYSNDKVTPPTTSTLDVISGNNNLFLRVSHPGLEDGITSWLASDIPNFKTTQTYLTAQPVLAGTSWINLSSLSSILGLVASSSASTKPSPTPTLDQAAQDKIIASLKSAIIYRRFEPFYRQDGQTYRRLILGLDKNKLVDALETLKDTHLDISLSRLNTMIDSLKDYPSLDQDLAILLINHQGYLTDLTINFPIPPKDKLTDEVKKFSPTDNSFLTQFYVGLKNQATNTIEQSIPDKKNTTVATLSFQNINTAPTVESPQPVVDSQQLFTQFQQELMPQLLSKYLGGVSELTSPESTPSAQPNNPNALPTQNYLFPGIPNASRQFASARDAQRRADLYSITNAIYQFATEHNGNLPQTITRSSTTIGTGAGLVDLTPDLVPTYIANIPYDPATGSSSNTAYKIYMDSNGRIITTANSELNPGQTIQVVR